MWSTRRRDGARLRFARLFVPLALAGLVIVAAAVAAPLAAPVNVEPPTISGTARVGEALTAHRGTWDNAPSTYRFRWMRCNPLGNSCVLLSADGETYRVGQADVGRTLRVRVTATNVDGSRNARSEQTRQQIALQVFTAYYNLQTSTERVRTAADLLASATESESVARGRYREGVGSIVDLLIAQSALADARAQDAQARWQWRGAMAQLAHDVGVLGLRGEALAPLGPADTSGTHR